MLLLLRLQLFAAALLVFLAFDGVKADGSEMYYRAVVHEIPEGTEDHPGQYPFHVEYCWRQNPTNNEECLQNDGNVEFNTMFFHEEKYAL